MDERGEGRPGARAVKRAIAILDCFAGRAELTLSEVAGSTGLPVSTTYRIMQALVRGGYLERGAGDAYRVGGHVLALMPRRSLVEEVSPHLYVLSAAIKITVSFGVVEDAALATLVTARPPVRYCAAQIPATREPLHATAMGKALLAFDPEGPVAAARRLGALDAFTVRTRTSRGDLAADLEQSRRSGFGLSDEELTEGVRAVAVPVFNVGPTPVGAIGVQARTKRMTDGLVSSLVPAMRHFAAEVGRRLRDDQLVHV